MNTTRTKLAQVFLAIALFGISATSFAEVNIGLIFPMTGPIATYGQESVNGIKLALKDINKNGVRGGQKLNIIIEDNKGEPQESANAINKLISVNKAKLVIGSVASSNTLAHAPIGQSKKVPVLTPASTNIKVTMTGNYVSRTCFIDDFQGFVMASFAKKNLGKKRAAIIVDNSSDYSKGLAEVFKREFEGMGGIVVKKEFAYTQKDQDFRSLLRKVKRTKPDVLFVPGYYTEVGLMLKQARAMGINLPVLGGDGWDSPKLQELAGDSVRNTFISSHFAADDKDSRVQKFVREYKAAYGQRPGAMAALGYDAIQVAAAAINQAKSLSHKDINEAITTTKNFVGVTGSISLDSNRNAKKSAVVLESFPTGFKFKAKVNP